MLLPSAWVEKPTQSARVLGTRRNPAEDHCPLAFADFEGHLISDLSKSATFMLLVL